MTSIELAIQMEVDGEIYYAEQAKLHEGTELCTVFLLLSRDERNHANLLRKKAAQRAYDLTGSDTYPESMNVFRELKDFSSDVKTNPDQMDVYLAALENEKKSIELYETLLSEAEEQEDKEIFKFLIAQEKEHYKVLDDLVLLLNRPKDWVEDAEFGLREEY